MQSSYSLFRADAFEQCVHPAYAALVYALSFFHAVVQVSQSVTERQAQL